MKSKGLRKLGERTWVLPGSPNTVIVDVDNDFLVIDPGIGENRGHIIEDSVKKLGGKIFAVALTHGHTDHFAALQDIKDFKGRVIAHRLCIGLIESLELRFNVVYGGVVTKKFASMPSVTFKVTDIIEWNEEIFPKIRAIDLHGHTPGHTGFLVEDDKVLVAGDSILGEKVLKRFGIPFASDLRSWAESLRKLEEYVNDGYKIVPGHGPIAEKGRAKTLIKENLLRVKTVYEYVYRTISEKGPIDLDKLAVLATKELSEAQLTPRQIFLNRTTLLSILSWLEDEGKIEAVVNNDRVLFKVL